jgi:hypothetical protein
MPVNKNLAKALVKKYGEKKGKEVYYAMENEKKKSFKKGMKTAKKEKHLVKNFPKKKGKK